MRILCLGNLYPPFGFGGYERIWAETVAALRAAGHTVQILTTEPTPGALPAADAPPDDPAVARRLKWYWREYGWVPVTEKQARAIEQHNAAVIADQLASFKPDVVSFWGMGGLSLALIEHVRRAGVPAVGLVADGWMVYGWDADAWMKRWKDKGRLALMAGERSAGVPTRVDLSGAAEWLFISDAVRSRAPELERTRLARPGVAMDFVAADPEFRWRCLVAGRVEEVKGVADAIRALALMPEQATLTIDGGGDPAYGATLRSLADELGVADRIAWQRSARDAMGGVYAAHDVVLFPVVWEEPWGLVPLEAMAVGRPVVATATGGTVEYIEHEANALIVRRERPREIANAVERLSFDPELRERLIDFGRKTAARFTRDGFTARVVAAHERAGGAGSATVPAS